MTSRLSRKFDSSVGPVGSLVLEAGGRALVRISWANNSSISAVRSAGTANERRIFQATARQLAKYFDGQCVVFDQRLRLEGSALHTAVWCRMRCIPFGKTITYGKIAKSLSRMGLCKSSAARSVAEACRKNSLPIIIPCHRVRNSKKDTKYSHGDGLKTKDDLLALERITQAAACSGNALQQRTTRHGK